MKQSNGRHPLFALTSVVALTVGGGGINVFEEGVKQGRVRRFLWVVRHLLSKASVLSALVIPASVTGAGEHHTCCCGAVLQLDLHPRQEQRQALHSMGLCPTLGRHGQ
jgi:hypothetical protein